MARMLPSGEKAKLLTNDAPFSPGIPGSEPWKLAESDGVLKREFTPLH